MAAETETLTITLSADIVQSIRDRVAAGDFASESDVIAARLQQTDDYSWLPDEPFDGMTDEDWAREDARRIKDFESGTMKTFTSDEVRQHLEATKREFNQR